MINSLFIKRRANSARPIHVYQNYNMAPKSSSERLHLALFLLWEVQDKGLRKFTIWGRKPRIIYNSNISNVVNVGYLSGDLLREGRMGELYVNDLRYMPIVNGIKVLLCDIIPSNTGS